MEETMRPSWLLMGVMLAALAFGGCDGQTGTSPDYQARVQAARERATDALCACAWSAHLREQCLKYANASQKACTPELAQRFADEQSRYADCVVDATERHARCLEETDCNARSDTCMLDVRLDCGPAPKNIDADLTVCLPRYRCHIGQEVSLDQRCDGQADCFDKSDEMGCD